MYIQHPLQVPVFVVAWLLIVKERWSFMPVGRTGGALLMGAVTVIVQTLTPDEAFAAVEYGTLALLWGMMVLVEYLKDDALFDMFVNKFFIENKGLTPTKLLWLIAWSDGCMSALFTNDTMCIALTKTICYVCTQRGYHPGPQMVAIAMSANLGSAATLIGNPQNAIIAAISGVPFAKFLFYSLIAMVVCLAINTYLLSIYFKGDLAENTAFAAAAKEKMAEAGVYGAADCDENQPLTADEDNNEMLETYVDTEGNKIFCFGPFARETNQVCFRYGLIFIIILTLAAFLADLDIGWVAASGGLFAVLLDAVVNHRVPDRIFARVNWELLIFFTGLFIVIEGLQETRLPGQLLDNFENIMRVDSVGGVCVFTALITIGCNIFNNVPLTLLVGLAADCYITDTGVEVCEKFMESIGDPHLAWILLAWVATVSGNLTLMGSVANLIVAEEGKHYFEMSFSYYSKFGFPSTCITLYVGVAIICAMYSAFQ